jgi:Ca2+-binding RTX toxin-like protein
VECPNPLRIIFQGRDGNDSIRNLTGIRSTLEGFRGNDPLAGGSAGDILRGNAGTDSVNGGAGRDFCDAETEANCEQ